MTDERSPAVIAAEARTSAARQRLFGTIDEIQARLDPLALAANAVENVAATIAINSIETVKARPRVTATAAAAAILFLARKPIGRLLSRGARHATATAAASLNSKSSKRSSKKD
ncbi:hypothetical protein [Sphingomonas sp.]|uniref:hypothetical protein n=1 Tax=Sphingomonas sp. TaxID=28214 RepID=UPI001EB77A74|nr:hypothetical protein [Sphingomonas sp.]MBX3594089.1 DUF3618 domain-containing protein [Sphingomonas sp.]